jgi:lambda repressor-like predicted transcriptional regulator
MANEPLVAAMRARSLSERQLAERVGVDWRTVQRWVSDPLRTPQPRIRVKVAAELQVSEADVWPNVRHMVKVGADKEVVTVYPSHSAVPASVWQHLVADAQHEIVFCETVSYWYWYDVPDLTRILREKAESGCRVRVMIGVVDDELIRADEAATDIPLTLSSRIEQTRHLLEPLRDVVQVRQTNAGWGRSVYRGGNDVLTHLWLHGQLGIDFPALHLRRRQAGGVFDQLVRHTEAVWEAGTPAWP